MIPERVNRDEISKHALLSDTALARAMILDSKSDARDSTYSMQEKQCFAVARKANNTYFPGNA